MEDEKRIWGTFLLHTGREEKARVAWEEGSDIRLQPVACNTGSNDDATVQISTVGTTGGGYVATLSFFMICLPFVTFYLSTSSSSTWLYCTAINIHACVVVTFSALTGTWERRRRRF